MDETYISKSCEDLRLALERDLDKWISVNENVKCKITAEISTS